MSIPTTHSTTGQFPWAAILTIAAGLLCGFSNPARAAEPVDTSPSVVVKYGDLNLNTEAGSLTLYARLAAAAKSVCPAADPRNLRSLSASRACQTEAMQRAVNDIRSPRLAALVATRMKHG